MPASSASSASRRRQAGSGPAGTAQPPPEGLAAEFERLRAENQRLRQLHRQQSVDQAVRAELVQLRKLNAELEERIGGAAVAGASAPSQSGQTAAASAAGAAPEMLLPRAATAAVAGASFNIKSWDSERRAAEGQTAAEEAREGVGEAVASSALEGTVVLHNGDGESSLVAQQQQLPASLAGEEAYRSAAWFPQPSLLAEVPGTGNADTVAANAAVGVCAGAVDAAMALLVAKLGECESTELRQRLFEGDDAGAQEVLVRCFARHLEETDTPYLHFSALIPAIFTLLREAAASKIAEQPMSVSDGETSTQTGSSASAASTATWGALARCAALVRNLLAATALHDQNATNEIANTSSSSSTLPRRPEGQSRRRFVRETCSRAGLALDLARVAFAQRRDRVAARRSERKKQQQQQKSAATEATAAAAPSSLLATPCRRPRQSRSCSPISSGRNGGFGASPGLSQELPPSQETPTPSQEGAGISNTGERGSRDPKDAMESSVAPPGYVEKKELQALLVQAGQYLSAMQMDMARLEDEHVLEHALVQESEEARRALAPLSPLPQSSIAPASLAIVAAPSAVGSASKEGPGVEEAAKASATTTDGGAAGNIVGWGDDDEEDEGEQDEPMPQATETQADVSAEDAGAVAATEEETSCALVLAPAAEDAPMAEPESSGTSQAATLASAAVETRGAAASIGDAPVRDPLVTPTFGEFLQKQLIPLYVADIPFPNIRHLSEYYCGAPLDSDDEEQAWKTLGVACASRLRSAEAAVSSRRTVARRRSSTLDATDSIAATPAFATDASLVEATELLSADRAAPMRAQMLSSVAEKRRTGRNVCRDMDVQNMPPPLARATRDRRGSTAGGRASVASSAGGSAAAGSSRASLASSRGSLGGNADSRGASPGTRRMSATTPPPRRLSAVFQSPVPARSGTRKMDPEVASLLGAAPSPVSTRAQRRDMDTTRKRLRPAWDLLMDTPQHR